MRVKSLILKTNFTDRLIRINSQNNINKIDKNNSILNQTLENKSELQPSNLEFRSNIYKNYSFNKFVFDQNINLGKYYIKKENKKIIDDVAKKELINENDHSILNEFSRSILKLVSHSVISSKQGDYLVSGVNTSKFKEFNYYCSNDKIIKKAGVIEYKKPCDIQQGSYFCNVKYLTKLRV